MPIPSVPHDTYENFRTATIGNSYDLDGYPASQPYQCWDYVDLLYQQSDVNQYLSTANTGNVKDCWLNTTARESNGSGHFELVYNVADIQKGDIIVFNTYSSWYGSTGHIGFADEDYNGTTYIRLLSQNFYGHAYVVLEQAFLGQAFLGAFRYKAWHTTPPTPPTPTTHRKRKFPWIIAWENWFGFDEED